MLGRRYGQWEAIKASIAPLIYFKMIEGQLRERQKPFQVEGTSCQESKAAAANAASGVISELRHLGAQPTACMANQGRARSMWPRPWPMVSSTASPLILDLVGLNDPGEAKRPQAVASRVDLGQEERAQRRRVRHTCDGGGVRRLSLWLRGALA